jgi:ABC-type multidrug transport system fused ATPase/permease subunit
MCDNTCTSANDGNCDDGANMDCVTSSSGNCTASGPSAHYDLCPINTDCDDCGGVRTFPEPSMPPSIPPSPSLAPGTLCSNTCGTASDASCDDGGAGADQISCQYGTDCEDCGNRASLPPPHPLQPTPSRPPPAPDVLARCEDAADPLCVFQALQEPCVGESRVCQAADGEYPIASVVLPAGAGGLLPTQIGLLEGLSVLYADAPASASRARRLSSSGPLSGTLPTQLGRLENLEALWVGGHAISGTLPTQIGRMANLRSMIASSNSISGFLPTQIGRTKLGTMYPNPPDQASFPEELKARGAALPSGSGGGVAGTKLTDEMDALQLLSAHTLGWRISSNSISGTIPATLANLNDSLTVWHAAGLRLSGTIPAGVLEAVDAGVAIYAGDVFLTELDLSNNELEPLAADSRLIKHCLSGKGVRCVGLPDHSCTAFGDTYRLSFTEAGECFNCPPPHVIGFTTAAILGLFLVALSALYQLNHYLRDASKKQMQAVMGTASILLGQIQILYMFTSMSATEGSFSADFMGILSAFMCDPSMLRIECLTEPSTAPMATRDTSESPAVESITTTSITKIARMALPLGVLLALAIAIVAANTCGKPKQADKLARFAILVFTLQLPSVTKIGLTALFDPNLDYASLVAIVGLATQLVAIVYLCYLSRRSQVLPEKVGADNASLASTSTETFSGDTQNGATVRDERANYRLGPLVDKYAPHARNFWLVVVLRQVSLIGIDVALRPTAREGSDTMFAQAGAIAGVLMLSLAAQLRMKPFGEEALPGVDQNRLESALLCTNIIQVLAAMAYGASPESAQKIVDAILFLLAMVPTTTICLLLARSKRLKRHLTGRASRNSRVSV